MGSKFRQRGTMDKKENTSDASVNDLSEKVSDIDIKVKVNRFDSLSSVDETDAIKIGKHQLFSSHQNHHAKHVEFTEEEVFKPVKEEELTMEEANMRNMVMVDAGDLYDSSHTRRGICLIIENDMFSTNLGLSKRKGSSIDRQLMLKTFSKLQFEVRVYQNLTSKDIERTLEKVSLEDHSNHDMLAVVILSHGNEGILYGYDSAYPAHKIWEPFTADKCSSLAGKPKLFFLQACQGSKMDHGVTVLANRVRTSTDSFASYRTPLHADFLLAHSTVAGYYSWRNTVQGSWFIQVLGRALIANYKTEDVMTIMAKVNKVVALDYESNSSRPEFNNKKQIPFIYSTLITKLFLKPK